MKSWVLTQTAPHRYVIGGKISLFLVEKQCRMAKMKIVRVLLFLVLLAGEYQLQSASIEAHCTPLMAANRQNLLCATNVLLLDKRMTIVGTLLASTMMISLKTERRSCDLGMPIHQALRLKVRNHHLRRRAL